MDIRLAAVRCRENIVLKRGRNVEIQIADVIMGFGFAILLCVAFAAVLVVTGGKHGNK